jgi:uncharacterized protein YegJ (DUF2314 family)
MKNLRLIFFLVVVVSCGQNGQPLKKEKEATKAEDKVHLYSRDNKDMNAAIAEAVRTWPEFESLFPVNDTLPVGYSVKMKFDYENGNEHMWLNQLYTREGKLYGVLDSDPMYVENLNIGDSLAIKKESVSDWMYIKNGKMIGGYTIRVMYNNLNEEEKQEFKASFPYEFE